MFDYVVYEFLEVANEVLRIRVRVGFFEAKICDSFSVDFFSTFELFHIMFDFYLFCLEHGFNTRYEIIVLGANVLERLGDCSHRALHVPDMLTQHLDGPSHLELVADLAHMLDEVLVLIGHPLENKTKHSLPGFVFKSADAAERPDIEPISLASIRTAVQDVTDCEDLAIDL